MVGALRARSRAQRAAAPPTQFQVVSHLKNFALLNQPARSAQLREMDLTDFADKAAGSLSGGNKRKLSVAIAMIGSPSIVFLDEPSTGMDPVSRRFMWDVISKILAMKCAKWPLTDMMATSTTQLC